MKISDYVESQIKGLWGTDFDENGIPVIKTNNLTYEGHIDYSDICKRNITEEQAKEWYLRPGDLLIEKSGGTKTHSVGYVSYFEGEEDKYVCNNFILALRPKNTINSKFLFYQIQFKYESNQFSDCFNKTTGIQNLKVKDYLAKEIKIYTPEEQEKIVSELDTVRSIINKNKQILEKYEILIKSRFIEMFGDPRINSKNLPSVKFIDVIKLQRGFDLPVQERDSTGTINVYGSNGVLGKHNEIKVKGPGIVTGRSGTLGKVYYVLEDYWPLNTTLFSVDTHGNNVIYLKYLLEAFELERFTEGAGVPTLNRNIVHEKEIINAPLELQQQFASFVQQIDKSKFEIWRYLKFCDIMKRIGFRLYD